MNQEEHLAMARQLMGRVDQESNDGGNDMIAAEFLWGAFAPNPHRSFPPSYPSFPPSRESTIPSPRD